MDKNKRFNRTEEAKIDPSPAFYSSLNHGSPRTVKLRVYLIDNDFKTINIELDCKVRDLIEVLSKKMGIDDYENFGLFEEWSKGGKTDERLLGNEQVLSDLGNKKTQKKLVIKCRVFRELNIINANDATTHLYYIQTKYCILSGYYYAGITNATALAVIQMQIEFGPYSPNKHKIGFMQSRIRDFVSTVLLEKHGAKHMEFQLLEAYSTSSSVNFT